MAVSQILILAPNSFPTNGPEGIVNAKLINAFTNAGYIIDVISKNNKTAYIPNELDVKLKKGIRNIITIDVENKINGESIIDHLKVLLQTGIVYKGAHWAYYAIQEANKLIKENKYDFILSRNPPSELAAYYLSKKHSIPWIANWNDPYPEKRMPHPYGGGGAAKLNFFEGKLLKKICTNASMHTFPSIRQRDYMLEYMDVKVGKTKIIPHVCSENLVIRKSKSISILKIIHSGNVSRPRDPRTFINGVKLFLKDNPSAKIEISFLGQQNKDFIDLIDNELKSVIRILSPLPYLENLDVIADHDVALIIEANSDNSVFLPTKIGDYMQCSLDIFAVSPLNGVLNDLYKDSKIKYFADCLDPIQIKGTLEKIYSDYLKGNLHSNEKRIISEYSTNSIMNIYNEIFNCFMADKI